MERINKKLVGCGNTGRECFRNIVAIIILMKATAYLSFYQFFFCERIICSTWKSKWCRTSKALKMFCCLYYLLRTHIFKSKKMWCLIVSEYVCLFLSIFYYFKRKCKFTVVVLFIRVEKKECCIKNLKFFRMSCNTNRNIKSVCKQYLFFFFL